MGQAMYAANAETAGAGAGSTGDAGSTGEDDVVDAEIVDEAPGDDGSAA
jgi:hypothetical protein